MIPWSLIIMILTQLLQWLFGQQQSGKTMSARDKKYTAQAFAKCNQIRSCCMAMGIQPDES